MYARTTRSVASLLACFVLRKVTKNGLEKDNPRGTLPSDHLHYKRSKSCFPEKKKLDHR